MFAGHTGLIVGFVVRWSIYKCTSSINPFKTEDPKRELANSEDTDQMPQNAASDQVLHCFLTLQPFFFRNIII